MFVNLKIESGLAQWIADPSAKGNKEEAAKRIQAAFEAGSTNLELTGLGLNKLPSCLGKLKKIEYLRLNYNDLESLPFALGRLSNLQTLDLNYNYKLTDLPDSLGQIPGLHFIATGGTAISQKRYDEIRSTVLLTPIPEEDIEKPAKKLKVENLLFSKRPLEVQQKIDEVYESLRKRGVSNWMHNGNHGFYSLLSFLEEEVIAQRISKANPYKKDLYFIDLGAGNFSWVDAVKSYLHREWAHNQRRHFHVIGVTGEGEPFDYQTTEGNVTMHKICGFKLENLLESFDQFGLHLENSVEFIVSSWTLRHLVDPLGTLEQAYHLLNCGNGLLFSTGFRGYFGGKNALSRTLSSAFGIHSYVTRKNSDNFDHFALFRSHEDLFPYAKRGFSYNQETPLIGLSNRGDSFANCIANLAPKKNEEGCDVELGGGFRGFGPYVLEQLLGHKERTFTIGNMRITDQLFNPNYPRYKLYLDSHPITLHCGD